MGGRGLKREINPALIRRVEHTENLKFKVIPTLRTTKQAKNYNVVYGDLKTGQISKAEVFLRQTNFSKRRAQSGEAAVTAMHELRENLLTQHDLNLSDRKVHSRALQMEQPDYRWVTKVIRGK
jgi:hypothetical protein